MYINDIMEITKANIVRIIIFAVIVIGIIVAMSVVAGGADTSTKYDTLAQCISQKKAKFYGAFWCPHCQAQKAAFGGSVHLLPYIECSNPDHSLNQVCTDAKIESFPTWEFIDGTRMTGELSMQVLADKTGCALPSDSTK